MIRFPGGVSNDKLYRTAVRLVKSVVYLVVYVICEIREVSRLR